MIHFNCWIFVYLDSDAWWNNIFDVKKEIYFETELERYPEKMRFSTTTGRKEQRGQRRSLFQLTGLAPSSSLKFLGDSTLSRDVSQFDFTHGGGGGAVDFQPRPTVKQSQAALSQSQTSSMVPSQIDGVCTIDYRCDKQ